MLDPLSKSLARAARNRSVAPIKPNSAHQLKLLTQYAGEGETKLVQLSIENLTDITLIEYKSDLEDIVEALHHANYHHEAHLLEIKLNSII